MIYEAEIMMEYCYVATWWQQYSFFKQADGITLAPAIRTRLTQQTKEKSKLLGAEERRASSWGDNTVQVSPVWLSFPNAALDK